MVKLICDGDIYGFPDYITEKDLAAEIDLLTDFYNDVSVLGKLPRHIRIEKIFKKKEAKGNAKERLDSGSRISS